MLTPDTVLIAAAFHNSRICHQLATTEAEPYFEFQNVLYVDSLPKDVSRDSRRTSERAYMPTCCWSSSTESKYGVYMNPDFRYIYGFLFLGNLRRVTRTSSTSSTGLSGREGGGGAADDAARAMT